MLFNFLKQYLRSMGDNFGAVVCGELYRGALPKDYRELRQHGITIVVNLIDSDQSEEKVKALAAGMKDWKNFPLSDHAEPDGLMIETILNYIHSEIIAGEVVYFSCIGGRHRSGLIAACYLTRYEGYSKGAAWRENERYGYYSDFGHEPLKTWFMQKFQVF